MVGEYYDKLCKCGCGRKILKREYHKWYGIPDYFSGHTGRTIPLCKIKIRKCKSCGIDLDYSQSRAMKDSCSKECAGKLRRLFRVERKCLFCGKIMVISITDKRKFCNQECFGLSEIKSIEIPCVICKKIIRKSKGQIDNDEVCCSKPCAMKYNWSKDVYRNNFSIKMKQVWKNPKYKKHMVTIGRIRKNNAFHSKEIQRENALKACKTNKEKGIGMCYDKEVQSRAGSISAELLRKHKNIKFDNNYFDSRGECEIGRCLTYQFNIKLIEGVNFQFKIKNKTFDFLLENLKLFIEYHPFNVMYDTYENYNTYYDWRRKILDDNGFKDYKLIIIP